VPISVSFIAAVDLDSSTDGTGGDNVGDLVHTKLTLTTGKGSLYGDPQQIAVFGFSYVIWNAATE
jgi:hypothetical protein